MGSRQGAMNLDCGPRRLHGGGTLEICLGGRIEGWGAGNGGNFPSKQRNSVNDETGQRTSILCLEFHLG